MDVSMMNNESMMGMMMACMVASALFALIIVIVVIIQAVIQTKILRVVRELKDKASTPARQLQEVYRSGPACDSTQ